MGSCVTEPIWIPRTTEYPTKITVLTRSSTVKRFMLNLLLNFFQRQSSDAPDESVGCFTLTAFNLSAAIWRALPALNGPVLRAANALATDVVAILSAIGLRTIVATTRRPIAAISRPIAVSWTALINRSPISRSDDGTGRRRYRSVGVIGTVVSIPRISRSAATPC